MRYSRDEVTVLGGFFAENSTVTIKVIDSTGSLVPLESNVCTAANADGMLYLWGTSNIQAPGGTYFYIMTDGTHKMPGKFIYGGYADLTPEGIGNTVWDKVV